MLDWGGGHLGRGCRAGGRGRVGVQSRTREPERPIRRQAACTQAAGHTRLKM